MRSVMVSMICCPGSPSALRFLLPQLLRVWSVNYKSSSLGIVLGYTCSLGTAHNPRTSQYGMWVKDRKRSVKTWPPDIRWPSGPSQLEAPESFLVTALHFSISLGQFFLQQSPGFNLRSACKSSPDTQFPRESNVRWQRMFLPNFSHIVFILNFLLWKYASIHKSQENNITHQPYQLLAIIISYNPLNKSSFF